MTTSRRGGHQLASITIILLTAAPVAFYAVVFTRGDQSADWNSFRAAATIVQVWVAVCVLTWLVARAADHVWIDERLDRAAIRLALPIVVLGLIAARVANRGLFGSNDRFHLILFPVLVAVVAMSFFALRRFLAVDRSLTPTPTMGAPQAAPPTADARRIESLNGSADRDVDNHLTWSYSVAGLCVCAAPVIWFLSVLCDSQEGLNALLMLAWAIVSVGGNVAAGWLLDRFVADRGGFLLILGRVLLAAVVVFAVAWPILGALTSDPNGSC